MAPEIVQRSYHPIISIGKAQTRLVDFWALGIFIYEMLVGKSPFYHKNQQTMFKRIVKGEFILPENLDEHSKSIIKRLLQVNVRVNLIIDGKSARI